MISQCSAIKNLLNHFSALGSKEITTLIPIFFYLIDEKILATKIFIGLIILYIIGITIRLTYHKPRPQKKNNRENLFQVIEDNSFPSMHSTRSTFILLILLQYFNFEIKISLFFLIIYITILYARIHKKRHDYKDLIAGIILGTIPFIIL
jgi:membrane-associated phospholipid phosphatase